jgi:creatinine amidohydrolase
MADSPQPQIFNHTLTCYESSGQWMPLLENCSWKRAGEMFRDKKIALIPVGATEQHGPHLPLGTDFFTAKALAEAAADKTGAICTPVIPIGVSAHHKQFWGTLWVSPETFRHYMYEVSISLGSHGVRRIIFVNGHGGNLASLQEISRTLRLEKLNSLIFQWWTNPSSIELQRQLFKSKGSHAGATETSMVLAIRPELVESGRYEEAAKGASAEFGIAKFGTQLPVDTLDFSQSGASLDPREATVEAGNQLFRAAEETLVNLIHWFEKATDNELEPKPHKE